MEQRAVGSRDCSPVSSPLHAEVPNAPTASSHDASPQPGQDFGGSSGVCQPPAPYADGADPNGSRTCQVYGCNADLSKSRSYYQRYRICKVHSQRLSLLIGDQESRFCQGCGRFHGIEEFDGTRRTCRSQLNRHNARRRQRKAELALARNGGAAVRQALKKPAAPKAGGKATRARHGSTAVSSSAAQGCASDPGWDDKDHGMAGLDDEDDEDDADEDEEEELEASGGEEGSVALSAPSPVGAHHPGAPPLDSATGHSRQRLDAMDSLLSDDIATGAGGSASSADMWGFLAATPPQLCEQQQQHLYTGDPWDDDAVAAALQRQAGVPEAPLPAPEPAAQHQRHGGQGHSPRAASEVGAGRPSDVGAGMRLEGRCEPWESLASIATAPAAAAAVSTGQARGPSPYAGSPAAGATDDAALQQPSTAHAGLGLRTPPQKEPVHPSLAHTAHLGWRQHQQEHLGSPQQQQQQRLAPAMKPPQPLPPHHHHGELDHHTPAHCAQDEYGYDAHGMAARGLGGASGGLPYTPSPGPAGLPRTLSHPGTRSHPPSGGAHAAWPDPDPHAAAAAAAPYGTGSDPSGEAAPSSPTSPAFIPGVPSSKAYGHWHQPPPGADTPYGMPWAARPYRRWSTAGGACATASVNGSSASGESAALGRASRYRFSSPGDAAAMPPHGWCAPAPPPAEPLPPSSGERNGERTGHGYGPRRWSTPGNGGFAPPMPPPAFMWRYGRVGYRRPAHQIPLRIMRPPYAGYPPGAAPMHGPPRGLAPWAAGYGWPPPHEAVPPPMPSSMRGHGHFPGHPPAAATSMPYGGAPGSSWPASASTAPWQELPAEHGGGSCGGSTAAAGPGGGHRGNPYHHDDECMLDAAMAGGDGADGGGWVGSRAAAAVATAAAQPSGDDSMPDYTAVEAQHAGACSGSRAGIAPASCYGHPSYVSNATARLMDAAAGAGSSLHLMDFDSSVHSFSSFSNSEACRATHGSDPALHAWDVPTLDQLRSPSQTPLLDSAAIADFLQPSAGSADDVLGLLGPPPTTSVQGQFACW